MQVSVIGFTFTIVDEEEESIVPPSSIKKNTGKKSVDINSHSVLEINNIMDSDGKPDDDEPTPVHSKGDKGMKQAFKGKKSSKSGSNANKGLMLIKEEKQTREFGTQ